MANYLINTYYYIDDYHECEKFYALYELDDDHVAKKDVKKLSNILKFKFRRNFIRAIKNNTLFWSYEYPFGYVVYRVSGKKRKEIFSAFVDIEQIHLELRKKYDK